jgi:hypothetical protein
MHDSFKQSAVVVGRGTKKHGKKKKRVEIQRYYLCYIALPSSYVSLPPTLLSTSFPTAALIVSLRVIMRERDEKKIQFHYEQKLVITSGDFTYIQEERSTTLANGVLGYIRS